MTIKTVFASMTLAAGLLASSIAAADVVAEGKALATERTKGNCLACHVMGDGPQPGNIAPPLVSVKTRFDKKALRSQISDSTRKNPYSMMPPFGRHGILSDKEIEKVVEYIYTL